MFHANHFSYAVAQSLGDTAITYALTAARWGVLGWDWYTAAFFSPAAARRYAVIGRWVGIAAVVAVALGMTARIYVQHWVDAQVEGALPEVAVLPPLTTPLVARPIAEIYGSMSTDELRSECKIMGVAWRDVHGTGRHLRKDEMVAALLAA